MSSLEARAEEELAIEPRLVEIDVADGLSRPVPPPEFVIKPLIPRGTVTLLAAHGGAGKSMLGLTWCAHVACGWGWGGVRVEGGTAVFVSLEDPAPLVLYRLQKIVSGYGLNVADVGARVRVFDGTDAEAALMTEVNDHGSRFLSATPAMEELEDAARGATLIVVDNASDGFDGNENDRRQVRAFVRRLARIARANNAGMVLLAHVDKHAARNGSKGNTYSGSTGWHNSSRSRLAMTIDEETDLIELAQEKLNLTKGAQPIHLSWTDDGVLVPIKIDHAAANEAANQQARDDAEKVLELLKLAQAEDVIVTTADSGPKTAWHVLCRLPETPKEFKDRAGRKRLEAALVALERRKQIVRETYKKPSRHTGERWALAQIARQEAA